MRHALLTGSTDEELVKAFYEGNDAAFGILVGRHSVWLNTFFFPTLKEGYLVEDAVQETFLNLMNFIQKGSFAEGMLFKVTMKSFASKLLADQSRKTSRMFFTIDDQVESLISQAPNGEQELMAKEHSELLRALVDQLLPEQREVFMLRYEGGFFFKEIAALTGVSLATCTSRMRYAIINLRRLAAKPRIKRKLA